MTPREKQYEVRPLDPASRHSYYGIWDAACGDWHRWDGEPAEYASRTYAEKFCKNLNSRRRRRHRPLPPRPRP